MKIGIMTHWMSNDNYGQQLQCYALQKYLRDAGHDAYLIRYSRSHDYIRKKILTALNPVKLSKSLFNKKRRVRELSKNDMRKFEHFRNKYISQSKRTYRSYYELNKKPPEADVYIVGSDQVWNPDFLQSIKTKTRAFFLDFGDSAKKRISYAASFGKDQLEDDFIKTISPFLPKFNYISVREKSGLNLLKQCSIDSADWAPDPTMLLVADAYRTLYKNEPLKKLEKRYCLLYYLNNNCAVSVDTVYKWAAKNNIEVVYVSANSHFDEFEKKYATIQEWIYSHSP